MFMMIIQCLWSLEQEVVYQSFFKGSAKNNRFVIEDNTFSYNHAIYGGGFYFGFIDTAMNNYISMSALNCLSNNALSDSDQQRDT